MFYHVVIEIEGNKEPIIVFLQVVENDMFDLYDTISPMS